MPVKERKSARNKLNIGLKGRLKEVMRQLPLAGKLTSDQLEKKTRLPTPVHGQQMFHSSQLESSFRVNKTSNMSVYGPSLCGRITHSNWGNRVEAGKK